MTHSGEGSRPGRHGRRTRLTRRGRLVVAALGGMVAAAAAGALLGLAGPFAAQPRQAAPGTSHRPAPPTGTETGPGTPTPDAPMVLDWKVRHERKLKARLAVPTAYRTVVHDDQDAVYRRRGSRIVEYVVPGEDTNRLRLTSYAARPRRLSAWAARHTAKLKGYWPDAEVHAARTRFHGHGAVLLDTTYTSDSQSRTKTRRRQLLIATRGGSYDLYVEMPKRAVAERDGLAVFRGARESLRLDGVRTAR
ncbi:hypothetical protein [Streptomyces pinistramenti]|uniref:hypothetical protein n=1 Tax=Streptomyces pinistramenti TaxID=2884812 RepID=UPI001D07A2B4|nr:hypothetical protein [Streptomyces pinistramenti]MCB5911177.1 hypothetical protein [Streptomyces pinistramenti]